MPLMTAQQFKKRSDHLFSRRSNPLIKDIDKLLDLWEKPLPLQRKLKVMVTLYLWCKLYLVTGGKKTNAVQELHDQVRQELESPLSQLTLDIRNAGIRDAEMLPGKKIEKPYQMESVQPKGKIGDVKLKTKFKRVNAPFLKDVAIEEALQHVATGQPYKGVDPMWDADQIGNYLMNNMTLVDQLDLLASAFTEDSYEKRATFEYCNEKQRKQYQVHIWEGHFYADPKFKKHFSYVAAPDANQTCMYAMDHHERLFVKPTNHVVAAGDGSFNHSSFCAGKPVVCAGELVIQNGRLLHIDNKSGHYRPTTGDLVEIIRLLDTEYGVDFSSVTVYDKTTTPNKTAAIPWFNTYCGAKPSP